jgi:hypothetical protein
MKKINLIILLALLNVVTWGVACTSPSSRSAKEKRATEVVIHSDNPIVIETLHSGSLKSGIYKVKVDSSEYVYISDASGVSIVKHK